MTMESLAEIYRTFAKREASGISPTYEAYAYSVAESGTLLELLLQLPSGKQQPNLLFAATRHVIGLPDHGEDFSQHVLRAWEEIMPVVLSRSTQTNEPGRCACFLPAFAQIEGPLSILEVGASAGLCLLPDLYGYDYGQSVLAPARPDGPIFPCKASAQTPLPQAHPQIAWRAGLDLNPLDVGKEEDMSWLKTLVWPEQKARRTRLEAAIEIAKSHPPRVVTGDLIAQTEALASEAPYGTRLVIFHTAVLNYVSPETRKEFAVLVKDLGAEWLANESVRTLPDVAPASILEAHPGAFVLSRNGRAIACTGPHGQFVEWL